MYRRRRAAEGQGFIADAPRYRVRTERVLAHDGAAADGDDHGTALDKRSDGLGLDDLDVSSPKGR